MCKHSIEMCESCCNLKIVHWMWLIWLFSATSSCSGPNKHNIRSTRLTSASRKWNIHSSANMPVAAPSQNEPQVPSHFRHLLPKPPGPVYGAGASHGQLSPTHINGVVHHQDSAAAYVNDNFNQYASAVPSSSATDSQPSSYFNTHSPPILNLSPNLSPSEAHRSSPGYDLRDSIRRRSIQGMSLLLHLITNNNK